MVSTDFTLTQGDVLEVKGQSDRIRLLFPQVSIKFEHTEYVSKTKNLWVTIEGATEDICYKCQVRTTFIMTLYTILYLMFIILNYPAAYCCLCLSATDPDNLVFCMVFGVV